MVCSNALVLFDCAYIKNVWSLAVHTQREQLNCMQQAANFFSFIVLFVSSLVTCKINRLMAEFFSMEVPLSLWIP